MGIAAVKDRTRRSVRRLSMAYYGTSLAYLAVGALFLAVMDYPALPGGLVLKLKGAAGTVFNLWHLYGFVGSMIMGVSYTMLPAMASQPLIRLPRLAWVQFWLYQAGLLLSMGARAGRFFVADPSLGWAAWSGTLALAGSIVLYAYNLGTTLLGVPGEVRSVVPEDVRERIAERRAGGKEATVHERS
ncbi:cbb3-type cytochrome c oxidase subunit I [Limnochorda pilosa]|nr:cbb3-type cytochrome c oxidase subunit I [Limnochorda pilosa]